MPILKDVSSISFKNFKKCSGNNNLLALYNNNPNFSLQARMIPAMAFVPIPQIDLAFAALSQVLPIQLQPVLDWLEDNYLGRRVGNINNRRPPLFPIPMWNVNNRVQQHLGRTNNYAEAAHRRFMENFKRTTRPFGRSSRTSRKCKKVETPSMNTLLQEMPLPKSYINSSRQTHALNA